MSAFKKLNIEPFIPLSKLADIVERALDAGGRVLEKGALHKRHVSFKTPLSPVTQVDLASERAIVKTIRKYFPTHTFLSEEMAHFQKNMIRSKAYDGYRWVVDPLDGTVNFIHKIPQSCVSVAVERNGVVWAGGVMDPYRHELFLAVRGKGATLNRRRIRVSPESKLKKSLIITGFPYDRNDNAHQYLSILQPVLRRCADLRRFGAAALDLAWVACGRAEGFLEYKLSPWDVAAGALLVTEAGGKLTDFRNRPYHVDRTFETLATNGRIHARLIRLLV